MTIQLKLELTGFFSVCNRHQLPEAIALGTSILAHHRNARYVIGFADEAQLPELPSGIRIIPAGQLALPGLEEMSARYSDFEFVHALRPWFARHLFRQASENTAWAFLAPEALVYSSFENILALPGDLLLTPNITRPLPASPHLDDKRILNIGMFHSNAWIARPTEKVRKLLDWWSARTVDRAFFDLCNGMCLDQLWLNYAPIHVPEWSLIRDPRWHIGLHNTLHTPFKMSEKMPVTGNGPVYTADFTGLHSFHPVWSDHTGLIAGNAGWKSIFRDYRTLIDQYAAFRIAGTPQYGRPTPVPPMRKFRKSVKSGLDQIIHLIDHLEI